MKGEQRKMKKFFKKLMVVVLAVAVSCVGVRTEEAEAGTCPHLPEYLDRIVMHVRDTGYIHYVEEDFYVLDEDGAMINLSDLTGQDYYVKCIVKVQEETVLHRCRVCLYHESLFTYTSSVKHSYHKCTE